jgi:hypothetical protein
MSNEELIEFLMKDKNFQILFEKLTEEEKKKAISELNENIFPSLREYGAIMTSLK